jgi:hypothetical protein
VIISFDVETSLGLMPNCDDVFYILATRPPRRHRLDDASQPGTSCCWLRNDGVVMWPDERRVRLIQAALAQPGGAVLLLFPTLADAQECLARLRLAS